MNGTEHASGNDEDGATMVYLVSICPVPDYDIWKTDIGGGVERRRRHGVTRHWVYRGLDDSNEVMLVLELPTMEHAKQLLASPDAGFRAWMERIGMDIYPAIFVGEHIEEVAYTEAPPSRQRPDAQSGGDDRATVDRA
jgi:predicted DNA-binding protein (UPF0278 family)